MVGINLKSKNEAVPAILPKTNPLTMPYPEVFGSISMMNMKNQLIMANAFIATTEDNVIKKRRNPAT